VGGEPERQLGPVVSSSSRRIGPQCCGGPLVIVDAGDEIWEARCQRCGTPYGLPPSQQSAALLSAEAQFSMTSAPVSDG
jgi:hypothetical protein